MTTTNQNTGVGIQGAVAEFEATPVSGNALQRDKSAHRTSLSLAGTQLSPEVFLALVIGFLAVGACLAPWFNRGWMWFVLVAAGVALVVCMDALALWISRDQYAPVLLSSEQGLRGREGQTIPIPLAFTASEDLGRSSEIRVAIMPATRGSEMAVRMKKTPERLKLEPSGSAKEVSRPDHPAQLQFWPWNPEIALLRRGLWPGPRIGVERRSQLRMWRLRRWFDVPESLRIDADLRPGRREILRSPVYRTLVASQQSPWTGHGREFERLREYQPGDNYAEIAWKSTARRAAPVTRLFQWEQKQEVYFIVDQSRTSALAIDPPGDPGGDALPKRAPRRLLDLLVETALVGATVALELGDEFGLVTYADEPKSWLRAGSGQVQFHQVREQLLNSEPLPTTADYEVLFSEIRTRLRRRAYLLLLADLTERSVSDSLRRGVGLVRSPHALLMTSILPAHARPAFSPGERVQTDQDVYAALTGEKENQRLGAMARRMGQLGVQLRYVPAEAFLRKAVEGYMENKREQRL